MEREADVQRCSLKTCVFELILELRKLCMEDGCRIKIDVFLQGLVQCVRIQPSFCTEANRTVEEGWCACNPTEVRDSTRLNAPC